jgi:uncharacterized membrane protein
MSVLFGTLAVPIIYAIGGIIGNRDVAITAAILLSLSPINVHYSQEARMYSLLTLAAAVSILGQAWLLRWPEAAGMSIGTAFPKRTSTLCPNGSTNPKALRAAAAWLAYILGTAAALWAHCPAVFLPLAANFIVLMSLREITGRSHFMRTGLSLNWRSSPCAVP